MAVALQPVSAPVTLAADGQPSIRRRYQPLTQIDARGIDDIGKPRGGWKHANQLHCVIENVRASRKSTRAALDPSQ
eukprot:CAMPEP_0177786750 /NCGR_PEP_ID=MMETSP0491_2-20121128/21098_1 /TAXON_ID=63592 /ORGANISM="Tetraselmis chuii, Strain PLY429" /LENGTH=75 /DNA_ID=CAMNT_0019307999 /DNA_START=1078 /DNA_END=1305 /DNA_ORIENTATION=-